jgi:hypothetical protein
MEGKKRKDNGTMDGRCPCQKLLEISVPFPGLQCQSDKEPHNIRTTVGMVESLRLSLSWSSEEPGALLLVIQEQKKSIAGGSHKSDINAFHQHIFVIFYCAES